MTRELFLPDGVDLLLWKRVKPWPCGANHGRNKASQKGASNAISGSDPRSLYQKDRTGYEPFIRISAPGASRTNSQPSGAGMILSDLIRNMAAAGATPEAIALAVEAIEMREAKIEARRAADRERKRRKKEDNKDVNGRNIRGNSEENPHHSAEWPRNFHGQTPSPSPPRDIINPPNPSPSSFSLRSNEPRDKRASAAEQAKSDFERFWSIWPNKVGKPAAAKAFFRVRSECEAIIAGVERYVRDKPADRPWLNPSTFLNQRRWEDCPAPQPMARASPPSSNRNGFAALAVKLYGNVDGTTLETKRPDAPLRLLSVDADGQRGAGDADHVGLFGKAGNGFG